MINSAIVDNETHCSYGYDVVEELAGTNITTDVAIAWPCELRTVWVEILPLVEIVRFLLSYATTVVVIGGVAGNVMSFVVFAQRQMCAIEQNLYLLVLAVYDTCCLVFNFQIGVIRGNSEAFNNLFIESEALCTMHGVVVEVFNILSVWMLVSFSIERFIKFKFPFKYTPSRRKTVIIISTVSTVCTLFSFHKIAVSGFEGDSVFGYKGCKTRRLIFKEIIYLYVALSTWLPTILITIANLIIINELRVTRRRRDQMTRFAMTEADVKTTKLLLLISTRYVLLVLPLGIVQTTELVWNGVMACQPGSESYADYMTTKMRLKWTRAFFFFFYQLNFAISFILYLTSSSAKLFRVNLRRVLGLKVEVGVLQPTTDQTTTPN